MLKISYAFRSLLASELAVWTYRAVLTKKHKIKRLLQCQGFKSLRDELFSTPVGRVFCYRGGLLPSIASHLLISD